MDSGRGWRGFVSVGILAELAFISALAIGVPLWVTDTPEAFAAERALQLCGNGICDGSEVFETCPRDCNPPNPLFDNLPPGGQTPLPDEDVTAADEPQPQQASPTSSDPLVPFQVNPTVTPAPAADVPERVVPAGCQITGLQDIGQAIQEAFSQQSNGYLPPAWLVCQSPPNEVRLPVDPALNLSVTSFARLYLIECLQGEVCELYKATSLAEGDMIYNVFEGGSQPVCTLGCSFALVSELDEPIGVNVPTVARQPEGGALLPVVLIAGGLVVLFITGVAIMALALSGLRTTAHRAP